ncbi:MAG: hypothetical protein IH851_04080 [Armatimonadetes bacterium]|nr:hypothetical protein [Armatimonadota bacterium]
MATTAPKNPAFDRTTRRDGWWFEPLITVVVLGGLDIFSSSDSNQARHHSWKRNNILNDRHGACAWASLVPVAFTEFDVRLVTSSALATS